MLATYKIVNMKFDFER